MPEAISNQVKRFSLIKCIWGIVRDMDAGIHAAFMRAFPRFLPIFDKLLEWLFGVLTNSAFALIAALLLVPLVATNVIKLVVAVPIAAAWLVALLWIARAEPIKALTVGFRIVFVAAIGAFLALSGMGLGKWTLREYNRQKIADRGEVRQWPEGGQQPDMKPDGAVQPHEAMEKSTGDPGDPPRLKAKPFHASSKVNQSQAVIQTMPTLERPKLSKEEIAELAKQIAKEMPGTTVTTTTKDQVTVHLCSSSTGFADCTDSELVAWGIGLASKIHDLGDRWRTETVRYREEHKSQSAPEFIVRGAQFQAFNNYKDCCYQDAAKFRSVIIQKLGPGHRDEYNDQFFESPQAKDGTRFDDYYSIAAVVRDLTKEFAQQHGIPTPQIP